MPRTESPPLSYEQALAAAARDLGVPRDELDRRVQQIVAATACRRRAALLRLAMTLTPPSAGGEGGR